MKFAVQLYSVRDHIKDGNDMLEVLGKVKEIGFDGVEFAGYFGLEAETLRKRCEELGLEVVGSHLGLDDYLPENLEKTIAYGKALGAKYLGVGGAPHDTYEEAKNTGDVLSAAGVVARENGMDTYYHNHTEEFTDLKDGKNAMDIISENGCKLEVDTYWSFCAGIDNVEYLKENKDKIVLIHIKDGVDRKPAALGEGENDLSKVVEGVKVIGLSWVVLENDDPVPCGLDDITRSYKWLKENF
ncbi:MAG: sugar phosphate isomerase/epimerase [Clostridia bacterium]|nr:sugar phosphate isomerase/epimerase [Clostridia bacterium]